MALDGPVGRGHLESAVLNRYAYVLNSPVTLTDPSGLCPECIPNDCGDPTYISAECGGPPDCVAEGTEGCIPFPIGYPVGLPGGGGTGGGGSTTGTGGTVTATAMPPGPLNGSQFGGPPGFQSTAQVIVQIGVYASPWEIDVLSICAGTPVCQDVLLGAAAGVLIYKGVQAGISIYKAQPKGSGKEKASDAPSWTAYYPREPNEPCAVYAARILLQKYGAGDPRALRRGPVSEYSQIKKACERGGL